MPIGKSNFKFQSHYTGLWSCINNPKEQFSGTLFIDQQKIWIKLCYIDSRQELLENIDSLDGCTYSIDSTGKETAVNIYAEGLKFIRYFRSGNGLNLMHYTYSVDCIIYTKENYTKTKLAH
jgi:hypothetical protein